MRTAVLQLWQHKSLGSPENEAGCSLHLTFDDHQNFVADYWEKMPEDIPQHYEAPFGKAVVVEVSDALYTAVEEKSGSNFGVKFGSLPEELQWLVPAEFTSLNRWGEGHMPIP